MHDSLARFIEEFHRDAALNGKYRNKIGEIELLFLELVWGVAFNFNFDGLKVEHPFLDFKGGQRFADFVYVKNGIRLAIEIDGFTTHARDLSPGEFNDHLLRQNDLVLSGWMVLRFSAWQVEHQPVNAKSKSSKRLATSGHRLTTQTAVTSYKCGMPENNPSYKWPYVAMVKSNPLKLLANSTLLAGQH